jgi:DNA polymerase-3 subunit gamma/tau
VVSRADGWSQLSYEVLARRWRPQTLDDVAGQSHVTTTLANALESGKLPHALLFAGPRGIGKTSVARILAKALNCDRGPTPSPCGECTPCVEIAGSTSLDVQEIDAASHTGVDSVREIRDSIRYTAAPGKHRIFIIDEVHMLSQAAFNALLKTLEEPPPNSLFIFATTDPQKIPATVLSRVQRFDLKRLAAPDLLDLLRRICKSEKIECPETVLRALVREGDGSGRDALTLLDRLISGLGTEIREEDALAVLDLVDRRVLWEILEAVLARDPAAALLAVRAGLDKGVEPARLAADLLAELRNLIVARLVDEPQDLIDLAAEEVAQLRERARDLAAEDLQRLFRVLLARIQDLGFAPRPAHAVEVAVVRLATLPETRSLAELLARIDRLDGDGPPEPPSPAGGGSGGGSRGQGSGRGTASPRSGKPRPGARASAAPGPEPTQETPDEAERPVAGRQRAEDIARRRQEAKAHPVVREAIDILDAEIRDIRPRAGS